MKMQWFLYIMGAYFIAVGAWFILYTRESRNFLRNFLESANGLFLSFLAAVFGILFMIASFSSHKTLFIFLLGVLALGKGCLFMANPRNIYFKARDWLLKKTSDQTHRLFGIVSLILGTAILSWV